MPTYKYKPYYKFNGPTRAEPLREELSANEVRQRLELFTREVRCYFEDLSAKLEFEADGALLVTTDLSQKDCDARVKRCLNSLDLYATSLSPPASQ